MSILSAMLGAAFASVAGELISQGTNTVIVERKTFMRYQCFQCKKISIHVHTIEGGGKAEKRLWNSAEKTRKKAAEKARKDISRVDELTFHEVNDAHNYGHINEEVFCPFCNARQPWSRGRGKKELDLLASPDYVHPVYYNSSNLEELLQIVKENSKKGCQPSSAVISASGKSDQTLSRSVSAGEEFIEDTSQKAVSSNDEYTSPFLASNLGKIRYEIEHRMLWKHFFADHQRMIALLESKNGLYTLYRKGFESAGISCPYQPEDFRVSHEKGGINMIIYSLELPEPEHIQLCYRIYLAFDKERAHSRYYAVERSREGGFLCGWDQNGTRLNCISIDTPKWSVGERDFNHVWEVTIITDLYNNEMVAEA